MLPSLLLILLLLVFAFQALRAKSLLISALWLAGVSAIVSVLLFLYGAQLVAVIELSVGAGLVTVLFVFAINIAGDESIDAKPLPPLPWIVGFSLLFIFMLGAFIWPSLIPASLPPATEPALSVLLWQSRGLDLIVQVALIFSGVLGLLGLLAEARPPLEGSMAAEVKARRDRELQKMDAQVLQIQEIEK